MKRPDEALRRGIAGTPLPQPSLAREKARIEECHLIIDHGQIIGRVTSVSYSPALHQVIGMAFIVEALTFACPMARVMFSSMKALPNCELMNAQTKCESALSGRSRKRTR